jgi:hypothetical protein
LTEVWFRPQLRARVSTLLLENPRPEQAHQDRDEYQREIEAWAEELADASVLDLVDDARSAS